MSATSLVFFSRFFSPSTAPSTNNTHEQKLCKWDISGRDLKKYANCQITMCLKLQKMDDFSYCLPYLLQLPHIVPDGRSSQIQFPNRWWYGKRTVLMSTLRKCIHWYISSGDILLCGDFFWGGREFFLKKDHTQCVLHILKPPHLPQAIRYGGQCLAKKVLTAGWMWPQETKLLFYILFVNI